MINKGVSIDTLIMFDIIYDIDDNNNNSNNSKGGV